LNLYSTLPFGPLCITINEQKAGRATLCQWKILINCHGDRRTSVKLWSTSLFPQNVRGRHKALDDILDNLTAKPSKAWDATCGPTSRTYCRGDYWLSACNSIRFIELTERLIRAPVLQSEQMVGENRQMLTTDRVFLIIFKSLTSFA